MIAVLLRMAEKTHIPLSTAKQNDFAALLFRVAESRDRAAFATIFDHFAPRVKSFMMRKACRIGRRSGSKVDCGLVKCPLCF
jgi:hypothetical protein